MINVSSSIDVTCGVCLDQAFVQPVKNILVTACCKALIHDSCWKSCEARRESSELPEDFVGPRPLTFRRCIICRQNATPLINLSTLAYQNSNVRYCRNDVNNYLQSQLAGAPPADGVNGDQNETDIPTLSELVRQEMGDPREMNATRNYLRFRHPPTGNQSACIESFPMQACLTGNSELVSAIVNDYPGIAHEPIYSVRYKSKLPMLFVAADNGHLELVVILARANRAGFFESLSMAIRSDNTRVLQALVGAAQLDESGTTAELLANRMYLAATSRDQMLLTGLLEAGVNANGAISNAIESDNLSALCELIEAGVNQDDVFYQVASKGKGELLDRLINSNTDAGNGNPVKNAALYAAMQQDLPALNLLTHAGVRLRHVLLKAIQCDAGSAAIRTILSAGVDVHEALSHVAAWGDDAQFARLLTALDTDLAVHLREAAKRGDTALVDCLLQAGVNPDDGNPTPLLIAAGEGHRDVVKVIFAHCASDVQYRSTKIYQAALSADDQTLLYLLSACNSREQNICDMTRALQKAISDENNGKQVLARFMQVRRSDDVGQVLINLINNNDLDTLTQLLQLGADPNLVRSDGWNLLHIAANKGDPALVKLLLDYGAALHQVTNNGTSALSIAANQGNKPVVEALVRADGSDDINSAISAAIERQDNDTLDYLIGMADMSGADFRQLLVRAARNNNIGAIKTMAKSCRAISASIAFLQAFDDNDHQLTAAFLKAGVRLDSSSLDPLLLMATVKNNATMAATMIRYCNGLSDGIYQAATARETEVFNIMLSAFAAANNREGINELIEGLIGRSLADINPVIFTALVDIDQRTGIVNIGNILLSSLKARNTALAKLKIAYDHRLRALTDRFHKDEELARRMDTDDEEPLEQTWQSNTIESRIAECDQVAKYHEMLFQTNEAIIQSFIQAGADFTITEDSGETILNIAVRSQYPEMVKGILTSWFNPNRQPVPPEAIRAATEAVLQSIQAQNWGMLRLLLTNNVSVDCAVLNEKRTLLYDVVKSGDSELVHLLWNLGVRAAPSLNKTEAHSRSL